MRSRNVVRALVGRVYPRRMPWHLLVGALALTCIGAAFIWSAQSAAMAKKHLVLAAGGCVVLFGLALLDYRHLSALVVPLYAVGIAALAALPFLGKEVHSAKRWYDLGFFMLQPSEPMKLLLVVALADCFQLKREPRRLRSLVAPLVLTGVPMALIAMQPDVGTALMLLPTFFVVAFLAGVPVRNLLLLVAAGCSLAAAAWVTPGVLRDYQRKRILAFVRPDLAQGTYAAAHADQAIRAVRAGGLKGEGWGRGVLNRRRMLSERHTDFIFAVIAEEWGFYRTAGVVALYMAVCVALGLIAAGAEDVLGRLLAGGVLAMFSVQGLMNMAIALRLAPITGLTLPLVSKGGSSLVTTLAAFGVAASVRMHRSVLWADERAAA